MSETAASSGHSVPAGAGPFSAFERMVALRYLRSRRKETIVSVIALISFIGIMLGVATLIIVMAVMNGFRVELLDRILGVNGHIMDVQMAGGVTNPRNIRHVVAAVRPCGNGRGGVVRIGRLIRNHLRLDSTKTPDLKSRTQPECFTIRRRPHSHAVIVGAFEQ